MPRRSARPHPDRTLDLPAHTRVCPACSGPLWSAATVRRTVVTLEGLVRLRLQVRSCRDPACPRHRVCLRPEQEGRVEWHHFTGTCSPWSSARTSAAATTGCHRKAP